MKRKEDTPPKGTPSAAADAQETANRTKPKDDKPSENEKLYLMDDGKLKPFASEDYTSTTLYQVIESYSVECKLVRPEDPANLVFEGKKPSKKTVPIIVTKTGNSLLLDSWEDLDTSPQQLADASEVLGATPVRQVFVLKRKDD